MASEVADLFIKLGLVSAEFTDGIEKAGAEAEGFSAKTDKIGQSLAKIAKVVAVAGIAVAAVSVKMAGDWQASMIKLVTSAGETGSVVNGKLMGPIKQVSDGLLNMAVSTGTSTKSLADAMYYVESAGFHGANGLTVMKIAAEGARAEGANVTTVADALTTGLHDMGKGAEYSVPMMNMMIRTVASGKESMEDFSGSLSAMLPQAAAAGVSFADVAAAEATMTEAGNTAQNSAQMIGHTLASLQSPNATAVKAMATFGLSTMDLKEKLGQRGLLGTMQVVDEAIMNHLGPDNTYLANTFNTSKVASQDLSQMMQNMAPQVKNLAQQVMNGTISSKDYSTALNLLPPALKAQGSEFLTLYKNADSFNQSLRNGVPGADTFAGALRKVLGDTVDTNTALQIGGANLGTFAANEKYIADGAKNAGDNIETWGVITQGFNFKIDQARQFIETTAIKVGTMLLPKLMELMDYVSRTAGPLLHDMGRDIQQALDSDAIHQAEAIIVQFMQNFGKVVKEAWVSVQNLWGAIQPLAGLLAGAFFLALQAVGTVMATVVGPAVEAVTGFLKDNSGTIKLLAEVILPALIGRLIVLKTLEVFTSLMTGLGTVLNMFQTLSKTIASGTMFDTLRLKAMYAADSVKNLGKEELTLQEEMAGATGATGLGGFMGKLGAAVPLVGAAAIGVSLLGSAFSSSGDKAAAATASVDQFTTAMIRSKDNTSAASMSFGNAAADLKVLNDELSGKLAVNAKFEGTEVVDLKRSFDYLGESSIQAVEPMAQLGAELGKVNQVSGKAKESLANYDAGLANLAQNGQLDRAKQLMAEITSVTDNHGQALINTARDFPQYFAALDKMQADQALGIGSTDASSQALNNQVPALNSTTDAMTGLSNSISDTMQKQQDMSAGLNADRSLDEFKKAIKDTSTALQQNGNAIQGDSDAAMANRDAIRGAVQAMLDNYNANIQNNMSTQDATQKLKDQITQFENQATTSDKTRAAIKQYIDQLNLIPPDVTTNINANTSNASANVDTLNGKLKRMLDLENDAGSTTTVTTQKGGVGGHPIASYDVGGFVSGAPGSPQLAIVHGGEYVVSLDEQRGIGVSPGGSGNLNVGGGPTIVINVQGSVIAERDLRDLVQTQMLQLGARYSTSYTPYKR